MSFRRRRGIAPVINSEKHEITWSNLAQDAGTATVTVPLVIAVAPSAVNLATEVPIGATVRSIFIEFNVSASATGTIKIYHWLVQKRMGGLAGSDPILYNQNAKKSIFKRGMEMIPNNVATVIKRVFVVRIPPRYRRMGQADQLIYAYKASTTDALNSCGIAIYKAFV